LTDKKGVIIIIEGFVKVMNLAEIAKYFNNRKSKINKMTREGKFHPMIISVKERILWNQ